MSTTITEAFTRQYESEVHHLFQRQGGILRQAVRKKDGIVGLSTTFQKIGKGSATTKARHGVITPANVDHTAVECILADFYYGDWVDKLDEAKIQHDEREALAKAGAYGLGRKVDEQLFTEMDATTQSALTFTVSSIAAIENSALAWVGTLDSNDVPNDGGRYAAVTPKCHQHLMKIQSYARADYVGSDGLPFKSGAPVLKWKDWMGVKWCVHTGCPGRGTASAKMFAWHMNAIGYATGAVPMNTAESGFPTPVMADITWHGDHAAHWVLLWMSGGAKLVEDTGVIECGLDDTAALPTS